MTTDGIRITTQAQADAVPNYSRGLWPDDPNQWFVTPAAPRDYLVEARYTVTHVATSVDQAAADRRTARRPVERSVRRRQGAAERLGRSLSWGSERHRRPHGGPCTPRTPRPARRRLPGAAAELPLDVAEKVAHWATPYNGAERVVVDAVRAALDAERGQE